MYSNRIVSPLFIEKSKIRDKIEELKKEMKKELVGTKGQDRYAIKQEYNIKIGILKEILGDE